MSPAGWGGWVAQPMDGELDLHTFRASEVGELVPEWLLSCRERGLVSVRIVHGKGTGQLRDRVITLLDRLPLVAWHGQDAGNWGARQVRLHPRETDATRITAVLQTCPRLVSILQVVAEVAPDAWLGAGGVRNPLWHRWHGLEGEPELTDLDVIWYDPGGLPTEAERLARLRERMPELNWELCNQALLPRPAPSLAESVARWPETATCVAARWRGGVELLAPLGLDDLAAMVLRHNPACPLAAFQRRLKGKRWKNRFPWATVMR